MAARCAFKNLQNVVYLEHCVSNLVKEHSASEEIFTPLVCHSAATCLPYSPLAISSASMLSNKALKLPSPKPSSPFR